MKLGLFIGVAMRALPAGGVGPVVEAPVPLTAATIAGDAIHGETLTIAYAATFEGVVDSVAYEWRNAGGVVVGEDEDYVIASADVGDSILLRTYASNEQGTSFIDSDPIGPIVAKTFEFTTSFVGTADTKLSTLGWKWVGGDDAFALNGSGGVKKPVSTAAAGLLVLEDTSGSLIQKIEGELNTSVNTWFTVLSKWNGTGADGYVLRRTNATELRLQRFVAGVGTALPSSNAITIPSGTSIVSMEATVGSTSVSIVIKADGTPVWSNSDTSAARMKNGAVGLMYSTSSNATLAFSSATVNCSNYIGGTGETASVAIRHGRNTLANNGSMSASLPSLGLLTGGEVGSWEFVKTSGSAKYPDTVSSGLTPAPTSTLTDDDAGAATVYSVYIDGKDSGSTFTINVQPILETDPTTSVSGTTDVGRLTKASMEGKVVEIVDGCGDAFGPSAPLLFDGFSTHTGTFKIIPTPGSTKTIKRLHIKNSKRVHIIGVRAANYLPPWNGDPYPTEPPGVVWQSNAANTALITVEQCEDIKVQKCVIGAPSHMQASPERWYTAFNIIGLDKDNKSNRITFGANLDDTDATNANIVTRCKDGINAGNVENSDFIGNSIIYYVSNAVFFSGEQVNDVNIFGNLIVSPTYSPADPADHRDSMQIGGTGVRADYMRIHVRRNVILLGDGTNSSQGLFSSDVGSNSRFNGEGGRPMGVLLTNGQYLTGYKFVDCSFLNNLYQIGHGGVDASIDLGTGWDARFNTLMRGKGENIQLGGLKDPTWRSARLTEAVSGTVHTPSGVLSHNLSHGTSSVTGVTKSNNIDMPPTGLATVGVPSAAGWTAFYEDWFSDIEDAIPIEDGPAKNSDGSYAGWKMPDGSWNVGA